MRPGGILGASLAPPPVPCGAGSAQVLVDVINKLSAWIAVCEGHWLWGWGTFPWEGPDVQQGHLS